MSAAQPRPTEEARIEDITSAVFALASLDFTKRATILDDGSALDGLAGAVNMLSEEIGAYLDDRQRAADALRRGEEQLRQAQKMEP